MKFNSTFKLSEANKVTLEKHLGSYVNNITVNKEKELYVLSCLTSGEKFIVKNKSFESAIDSLEGKLKVYYNKDSHRPTDKRRKTQFASKRTKEENAIEEWNYPDVEPVTMEQAHNGVGSNV